MTVVRRPPPAEVSARQFRLALALAGFISEPEAEAWARREALPPMVAQVIASLPQAQQFPARMAALDMTTVPRADPVILAALGVIGATEAQLDDLFRLAATL